MFDGMSSVVSGVACDCVCVALSIALYRFCHRVFFGVIIGSATMRQCVSLFVAFLSRLSLRAVNCSVGVVIIFA